MRHLFAILLLVLYATTASAEPESRLRTLLEGKATVYIGQCGITAEGKFSDEDVPKMFVKCVIGVDHGESGDIYYALMYQNGKPSRLLKVDKDNDTQTFLWRSGSEA